MFKDYYQILGIPLTASKREIKQAYRKMSLKWHPDKNPNTDVTDIMQDINEAYKILNDDITRTRYDKEYQIFCQKYEQQSKQQKYTQNSCYYDYTVKDENLQKDINEAKKYAKDTVEEFLKNLKETSKVAVEGAWHGAYGYILGAFFITIIFALIRTCQ